MSNFRNLQLSRINQEHRHKRHSDGQLARESQQEQAAAEKRRRLTLPASAAIGQEHGQSSSNNLNPSSGAVNSRQQSATNSRNRSWTLNSSNMSSVDESRISTETSGSEVERQISQLIAENDTLKEELASSRQMRIRLRMEMEALKKESLEKEQKMSVEIEGRKQTERDLKKQLERARQIHQKMAVEIGRAKQTERDLWNQLEKDQQDARQREAAMTTEIAKLKQQLVSSQEEEEEKGARLSDLSSDESDGEEEEEVAESISKNRRRSSGQNNNRSRRSLFTDDIDEDEEESGIGKEVEEQDEVEVNASDENEEEEQSDSDEENDDANSDDVESDSDGRALDDSFRAKMEKALYKKSTDRWDSRPEHCCSELAFHRNSRFAAVKEDAKQKFANVRAKVPFSGHGLNQKSRDRLFYFEITVKKLADPNGDIALGVVKGTQADRWVLSKPMSNKYHIGERKLSYAVDKNGILWNEGNAEEGYGGIAGGFGEGDTVGCGMVFSPATAIYPPLQIQTQLFFTKNGEIFGKPLTLRLSPPNCKREQLQFYPSVTLSGQGTAVLANFGNVPAKPFRYNIRKSRGRSSGC